MAIAKKLHPEIKRPTKQEVESDRARTDALRDAIHAAIPGIGWRRRKPRAKALTPQASERVAEAGAAGIEIDLDY